MEQRAWSREQSGGDGLDRPELLRELGSLKPVFRNLGEWVEAPTGRDPRIRFYAKAARYLLATDPRFRAVLNDAIDFRKQRGRPNRPLYFNNLTLRVAQHLLRKREDYAELSATPEGWIAGLSSILDNPELAAAFDNLLAWREVQTNVPARYMGPQLAIALNRDRFKSDISLLDVGPSIGAGIKGLITGNINHRITAGQVIGTPDGGAQLYREERLDNYINQKVNEPIAFGQCVGVDLLGFDLLTERQGDLTEINNSNREWTESCFYPGEVVSNQNGIITEYRRLAGLQVPNYRPYQANFTYQETVKTLKNEMARPFDVVTILTMLNQLTERERVKILANAKQLVSPEGLIIIQDFAVPNPAKKSGLQFFPSWHPYTNRTMIIDMKSASQTPEEILWWSNGRCEDVIIAPTAQSSTRMNVSL